MLFDFRTSDKTVADIIIIMRYTFDVVLVVVVLVVGLYFFDEQLKATTVAFE